LASGFTAVTAPLGGTGQTSYAVGDILYASTSTALSKLADVAVGNALISGGVGAAPSYGKIGLATHVSGTLPVANGGTGSTATTFVNLTTNVTGTLPVANGGTGNTTAQAEMNRVAGAVTSGQYLRGNGTNVVMSTIQAADVPTLNQNTTGTAAGLSTTLAVASGGTGQTTYTNGQLLIGNTTGSTLTKATLTAGTGVTVTNGAGSISISLTNPLTHSTTVSASTTVVDFTGLPSGIKQITVLLNGVSTNGTSPLQIQIGTSGGFVTTGYSGATDLFFSSPGGVLRTTGFGLGNASLAAYTFVTVTTITSMGGNVWVGGTYGVTTNTATTVLGNGAVTLGGTLDRVRITTVGGVNTFDAGTINILYQ
jgi:hypothetical protein